MTWYFPSMTTAEPSAYKSWKWPTLALALISSGCLFSVTAYCLENRLWNSRTVHMEEYYAGSRPTNPQSFWGLVWGVGAESGSNVHSVSASTCFKYVGTACKECQSSVKYKQEAELCGPNLWHMAAICSYDGSSDALLSQYVNTLDMKLPPPTQLRVWTHGDPGITETTTVKNSKGWHGELCKISKIKPIVSFATDSHSYSFMVSGNTHVYMFTIFAVLTLAFLSEFGSLSRAHKQDGDWHTWHYQLQGIVFLVTYILYFVLWNHNFNLSILKETLYDVIGSVWTLKETCTVKTCVGMWSTGDSCTAGILLTWIVFSYYAWLVWSSEYTSYKTYQVAPDNTSPGQTMKSLQSSFQWGRVDPSRTDVVYSQAPLWNLEDQIPLMFRAENNLKNYPTADGETKEMPAVNCANLDNVSQSSHVAACTLLFVFPLWVAASLSSRKFSLDTFVQSRLVVAAVFGMLQYAFMSIDWLSGLPTFKRDEQKPDNSHMTPMEYSVKLVKLVVTVMQSLLILLQALILVYYFLRLWPSDYEGMEIVLVGAFLVIILNFLQLGLSFYYMMCSGTLVQYQLNIRMLVWIHRALLVVVLGLSVVMYLQVYQTDKLIATDVTENSGMSQLIHDYWVYGSVYNTLESKPFNYALPASYL